MQQSLIARSLYKDPLYEQTLLKEEERLLNHAEIQARQDGSENSPTSSPEFSARFLNWLQSKLQGLIEFNHQTHQPVAGAVTANSIRIDAESAVRPIQNSLGDDEYRLREAQIEVEQLKPACGSASIRRKIIMAGLGIMALAEGYWAGIALRFASFPWLCAVLAGAGIAVGAFAGAHCGASYIRESQSRRQHVQRYLTVLLPAALVSLAIAYFRAQQYSYDSGLSVSDTVPSQQNGVSAIWIALLSFLLFCTALFISIRYWQPKAVRAQEEAYKNACEKEAAIKNEMMQKQTQIVEIKNNATLEASHALSRFEYARASERRIIALSKTIAEHYKQVNLRHRSDGCPEFFVQPINLFFVCFFDRIKQKEEAA